MRSLLNAKKLLKEIYGEVPPMIGFLGVDTDKGVYDKSLESKCGPVSLDPMEQMSIGMKRGDSIAIYQVNKEHFSWIPDENVDALENLSDLGAGQIRSNGRFAFISNYQNVEAKVRSVVNNITQAQYAYSPNYELLGSGVLEIHMAFSVCGGTGCGSFIDMAYLLRRMVPESKIVGYAVLPEVFDAMTNNQAEKAYIFQNAYGALQDLDYTMHFARGSQQKFNLDYVNNQFDAVGRPFDSVYLVGNKNSTGDSYLQADQLAEMISLALVTSAGELSGALASVSDNLEKVIREGQMNILDKTAWVAGMGVCEIVFKGKELREAYSTKVEHRLISRLLNNQVPDVMAIVDNWIDSPQVKIRENGGSAHDDVIDFILPKNPKSKLQGINNKQNALPEVQNYLASSMVQPKASEIDAQQQALTTRVNGELSQLIRKYINQEGGVGLCLDILSGINRQVDIFVQEMNDELNDLQGSESRIDAAIATSVKLLQEASSGLMAVFRKGDIEAKTQDLIAKTNQLAACRRDILRHQSAISFFNGLKADLMTEENKVKTIRQLLRKVASDCDDRMARNSNAASLTQTFQIDLSEELLKSVTYDDEQIVVPDFLRTLPGGITLYDFDTLTSEQVAEHIHAYAYNLPSAKVKEETTLDSVIDAMPTEAFQLLLKKAIKKSSPLIDDDYKGYQNQRIAPPADSYYIGVSNMKGSRLIMGSSNESEGNKLTFKSMLSDNASVHFANIGSKERIIIFRQYGVLPTYAVKGIDLYKTNYVLSPRRFHLDANLYRRMMGEEFELMPKVAKDDSLELWVKGIIFGLIRWDADKKQYMYQNHKEGKLLHEYWMPLGQYRNDAFVEMQKKLTIVREEFGGFIKQLRTEKGAEHVEARIQEAKNAYYDPRTGQGEGLINMDINELESRGNEAIYQLVEREIEYISTL